MAASVLYQFYEFKLVNSGVLIVNFEQDSHAATVLLLLTLNDSMSTRRAILRFCN